MTEKMAVYKCSECGNIIEVLHSGNGELVCCGKPMEQLQERTQDMAHEKHVPIIKFEGETKTIRVGSIPHPMEEQHYIMFIEAISKDGRYITRKYLNPGEEPKMDIKVNSKDDLTAREYCNLHGLWKSLN